MSKLSTFQIERHIQIRAEALAEQKAKKLFEEWKSDFLKQRKDGDTFTLKEVLLQPETNRMRMVYEAIADNDNADIHTIQAILSGIDGKEVAFGTISGRIGDLVRSELIEETGKITGKFGRLVSTYTIVETE